MKPARHATDAHYAELVIELSHLLESARRTSARVVNAVMTATYWELGRRIVKFEQLGARRAAYGEEVLARLAADLTKKFGRGFSLRNLRSFRMFYQEWPIRQTLSAESCPTVEANRQTASAETVQAQAPADTPTFPPPWSHYVVLLGVKDRRRSVHGSETML